ENPDAVDASWRAYFDSRTGRPPTPLELLRRVPHDGKKNGNGEAAVEKALDEAFAFKTVFPPDHTTSAHEREGLALAPTQARVYQLLNAYRVRGHLFAHVDPLGLPPAAPPELDLTNFGLRLEDLDKPFPTVDLAGPNVQTLREIINRLEETYCRSIGVEF